MQGTESVSQDGGLKLTAENRALIREIRGMGNEAKNGEEIVTVADDCKKTAAPQEQMEKKQKVPVSDILKDLVLFHDEYKRPFIFYEGQCFPAKALKSVIVHQYYKKYGKVLSGNEMRELLTIIESTAIFEEPQCDLHNRIAPLGNSIYYDMGDKRAIEITKNGWHIYDAPIIFRRYSHQKVQVDPVRGGDINRIFEFVNISNEQKILLLVSIISYLIPDIAKPVLHPHGSHGSGKTCLCNIIKRLVDPSIIEALITPRKPDELIQVLSHHHVALFDNIGNDLPQWMSDIFAQACTGGGFSKRELFTDDNDIIFRIKRCLVLNGINVVISKPDLMDRTLIIYLDRIPVSKRVDEKTLWQNFEAARPEIFGGMIDALQKAMAIYPTVNLKSLPRMADFARWGYAITEALGIKGEIFLQAYAQNIHLQNAEIVDNNTFVQAILAFMEERQNWEGTVGELYTQVCSKIVVMKGDLTFPQHVNKVRKHLERVKPTLSSYGIEYWISRTSTYKGVFMRLEKFCK